MASRRAPDALSPLFTRGYHSGGLDGKATLKVHDLADLLVRLQTVQEPATASLDRLLTVELSVKGDVLGEAKGSDFFCGVHVVIIPES